MQSSRTRAFRFVALAHIPTGMLRWKRGHVSARILPPSNFRNGSHTGPRIYHPSHATLARAERSDLTTALQEEEDNSTARHNRQAQHNSQNLLNISTSPAGVNFLSPEAGATGLDPTCKVLRQPSSSLQVSLSLMFPVSIQPTFAARRISPQAKATLLLPSSRKSSITAVWCGTAGRERWRSLE